MRLTDIRLSGGEFQRLLNIGQENVSCSAFSLSFAASCYYAARLNRPVLFLFADYLRARRGYDLLMQLEPSTAFLPPKDDILNLSPAQNPERSETLGRLVSRQARIIAAPIEAAFQRVAPPDDLARNIFGLQKGKQYKMDALCARLSAAGYERVQTPVQPGEFSVRGDIMDIIRAEGEAFRCEFFGDELETIRELDVATRLSRKHLDSAAVFPANEPDGTVSLTEYFPPDTIIIFDEAKSTADSARFIISEHENRFKSLLENGNVNPDAFRALLNFEEFIASVKPFCKTAFHAMLTQNRFFAPDALLNFRPSSVTKYSRALDMLATDARALAADGYRVVLCARDESSVARIGGEMFDRGLLYATKLGDNPGVYLIPTQLDNGFTLHEEKLAVIGTGELMARAAERIKRKASEVFTVSDIGDFVVHSKHGLGKIIGIERLGGAFGATDFIIVGYSGGDKLYVPTVEAHRLSRYSGVDSSGADVKLNKIGGADFAKVKSRVSKSVREMAFSLVKLYAERELKTAEPTELDERLFGDFSARFPFNETDDQLRAVADVLRDLASGRVMDRLLCGDVGYGKTEVALRAAFAVILSGKQVAFLAPTTILTEQHYRTALKRMDEFGVSVGVLSRFHSDAENKEVIRKLAAGEIDIVFGTHRLLSKDVQFRDVGLLVLDEEQRFGVEHKEKIKELKKNVHVLTLSATPIPRTLHMSMSRIRDMSVLDTPPADRLPVRTFVSGFSAALLRDAASREIGRGGQVFIVYNRVQSIDSFAADVKELLPEARILVGHGQMPEDRLEKIIDDFYAGNADILIASTIIENGIDISNANTLIIIDSDRLGLAQMYQLRGRVGRSNRLAYAYFTFDEDKILTTEAEKRLEAIAEFTEFGSGFKLAMRDLEIRGAGTVLGREQHGHMERVGYDLYLKLLDEAINEIQGKTARRTRETTVNMRVESLIPDTYIEDGNERMHAYQRIAGITNDNERKKVLAELSDIYGSLPESVINISYASLIRYLGEQICADRIEVGEAEAKIYFEALSDITQSTHAALAKHSDCCILKMQQSPIIAFDRRYKKNVIANLLSFLTTASQS